MPKDNKKLRYHEQHSESIIAGVFYDISWEKICWWLINHFYITGQERKATEFGKMRQNNGHYAVEVHLKSPIFGTKREPICDFLLVINTNLPLILHYFQVMADYMSNFP